MANDISVTHQLYLPAPMPLLNNDGHGWCSSTDSDSGASHASVVCSICLGRQPALFGFARQCLLAPPRLGLRLSRLRRIWLGRWLWRLGWLRLPRLWWLPRLWVWLSGL